MTKTEFISRLVFEAFEFRYEHDELDSSIVTKFGGSEIWVAKFDKEKLDELTVYREVDIDGNDVVPDPSLLEQAFGLVTRAWQKAATDLGITFISPYRFNFPDPNDPQTTKEAVVTGFLPDFGMKGTVIMSRDDHPIDEDDGEASVNYLSENNINWTALSPHYEQYNRESFMETLADYGWYGDGCPPDWYAAAVETYYPEKSGE